VKSKDNILWIDLETTGLDPDKCSIIEVAAVMTTPDLFPLGYVEEVVRDLKPLVVWEQMNQWCRDTHKESGLWQEVEQTAVRVGDAECQILALIDRWMSEGAKPILGGQSVHFDRGFIAKHMPDLHKALSHRHLDVSAFMEGVKRWGTAGHEYLSMRPAHVKHRALDDIQWSIRRMEEIRREYFPE